MTMEVFGVEKVISLLDAEISHLEIETPRILNSMLAGISMRTRPYVPVDTGRLINSEDRRVAKTANGWQAGISYLALNASGQDYAAQVHDGPQRRWKKPGASNKFLEKGLADFISKDFDNFLKRFT